MRFVHLVSLSTKKESAHPPGNGFSRALESLFLVPKNKGQCFEFHFIGPFSLDTDNLISNILHFVKNDVSSIECHIASHI